MGRQSRASHSPNRWLRRGREGEARVYARGSSPPSFADTSILLSRVIAICDPAKSPPRIPPRNRTHAHIYTYIHARSFGSCNFLLSSRYNFFLFPPPIFRSLCEKILQHFRLRKIHEILILIFWKRNITNGKRKKIKDARKSDWEK